MDFYTFPMKKYHIFYTFPSKFGGKIDTFPSFWGRDVDRIRETENAQISHAGLTFQTVKLGAPHFKLA